MKRDCAGNPEVYNNSQLYKIAAVCFLAYNNQRRSRARHDARSLLLGLERRGTPDAVAFFVKKSWVGRPVCTERDCYSTQILPSYI